MNGLGALIRREFYEHRGAFLLAPLALVGGLFTVVLIAYVTGRLNLTFFGALAPEPLRLFELVFLVFGALWWLYLMGVLFFYCADGFSADRRDNAMLFWKSMPQSDLKILLSKFLAAMTVFPGLILVAALLCGVLAFIVALLLIAGAGSGDAGAFLGVALGAFWQVSLALVVALAAALLWYAPFLAWVGALATVVGRWAVPLSLLIPALAVLIENVFVRGLRLSGGDVWQYLAYRADFPVEEGYLEAWFLEAGPFDGLAFVTDLVARVDWLQVLIGLVFAAVVLVLASQYRRRVIA